ncbi:MAG: hypothetical protein K6D98_02230 [Clostridiales bacterium]|nr:hypothetical protein [Clostridiales bacterium]
MTYYVDSVNGKPENSGKTMDLPLDTYLNIKVKPGDTILFKAGSVFRTDLFSPDGKENAVITWGMYGEGAKPTFLLSQNVKNASDWKEVDKNIWFYTSPLHSEACNLIFNYGDSCGVMVWEYGDMKEQGQWYSKPQKKGEPCTLYMYSEKNPAEIYTDIECAVKRNGPVTSGAKYVRFENLYFLNVGSHVYAAENAKCVSIVNCDFKYIGGRIWDRKQRIRFGNAIEIWEYGEDVLIDRCTFDEIYDSATTHQGFINKKPCLRINITNNVFKNHGMAAFELRDLVAVDSHFDNNICIGAGLGFSLQGEISPRKSELWPQPMGHHLFIWRIPKMSPGGSTTVHNNVFYEAPYGALIYSTALPDAESQIDFDNNVYYKTEDDYLIRLGGKNYGKADFERYKKEQNQDKSSRVEDIYKK